MAEIEKKEEEQEFKITIREVLERTVTVKAKDLTEAKQKVGKMYYDEDIVLDAGDFVYREMREAKSNEDYEEF